MYVYKIYQLNGNTAMIQGKDGTQAEGFDANFPLTPSVESFFTFADGTVVGLKAVSGAPTIRVVFEGIVFTGADLINGKLFVGFSENPKWVGFGAGVSL